MIRHSSLSITSVTHVGASPYISETDDLQSERVRMKLVYVGMSGKVFRTPLQNCVRIVLLQRDSLRSSPLAGQGKGSHFGRWGVPADCVWSLRTCVHVGLSPNSWNLLAVAGR